MSVGGLLRRPSCSPAESRRCGIPRSTTRRHRNPFPSPESDEGLRKHGVRSVVIGLATWVVGHGGFALWDSRTEVRSPLPSDFGHDLGLLAVALLTILFGPPIGMYLGLRGLPRRPGHRGTPRRGAAVIGLSLNFWVWGFPLASLAAQSFVDRTWGLGSHFGLVWWIEVVVTVTGVLGGVCWGIWLDFGRYRRDRDRRRKDDQSQSSG